MKNIEVYTINNCGYCEAAKNLLKENGLQFKEFNIDGNNEKFQELMSKTHHRTMPQIFVDHKFIGGYAELKALLNK